MSDARQIAPLTMLENIIRILPSKTMKSRLAMKALINNHQTKTWTYCPRTIHHRIPNTRGPKSRPVEGDSIRFRTYLRQSETNILSLTRAVQSPRSNSNQDLDGTHSNSGLLSLNSALTPHRLEDASARPAYQPVKYPPRQEQGDQNNTVRRF
jgi:hypothetical protein